MAIRCPVVVDRRRNQPQDLGQSKGLRENLSQAEDWRQKRDCQQR
jgi:hypothetical protein